MNSKKVYKIEELHNFALGFLDELGEGNHASVVGLVGDLGAGKTALTKQFAKVLGVAEEVTSPTFVLMKSYPISAHPHFKTLTHIDAYRIDSEDEMSALHFEELLRDPTQLIVIEWPERIKNLLPNDTFYIQLKITEGETREISYAR